MFKGLLIFDTSIISNPIRPTWETFTDQSVKLQPKGLLLQTPTRCTMKMIAFWYIAPCRYSLVERDRRFIRVYGLHHQGDVLIMDAVRTSETSVYFNETKQRDIPVVRTWNLTYFYNNNNNNNNSFQFMGLATAKRGRLQPSTENNSRPTGDSRHTRWFRSWESQRESKKRNLGTYNNCHFHVKMAPEFVHAELLICITFPEKPGEVST
jgi:hypothetical protein